MFCLNCRNQVVGGVEICPYCGTNLKQEMSQLKNQNIQLEQSNMQTVNFQTQNGMKQSIDFFSKKKVPILLIVIIILLGVSAIIVFNNVLSNNTDNDHLDTNLTYDQNGSFLMPIEDVSTNAGRGTVVMGTVERGVVNLGDQVQIIGLNHETITTSVVEIQMLSEKIDYVEAGDKVSILLKDVAYEDIETGQVMVEPNSIKAVTQFDANVYMLSEEEGGRKNPFSRNYRPQFYFRTIDVTGIIVLPDGVEMVMPGDDNVKMTVDLVSSVAIEVGTEFSIREMGRIVGRGTVTKVY